MLHQTICADLPSVTSSPESESGAMLCDKLDGQMIGRSGQEVAHANLSARQAKEMDLMTRGTYGQHSIGSSKNAALSSSLASRLQAKTGSAGSTLFNLTWKQRITPRQHSIYALRASALRTSGSGYSGWPTPRTCKTGHTKGNPARALRHRSRLEDAIFLLLNCQERIRSGAKLTGCVGLTDFSTQLNPEHCRWLMGIPKEWAELAPMETPSFRK